MIESGTVAEPYYLPPGHQGDIPLPSTSASAIQIPNQITQGHVNVNTQNPIYPSYPYTLQPTQMTQFNTMVNQTNAKRFSTVNSTL
jgi:hypothetical protein